MSSNIDLNTMMKDINLLKKNNKKKKFIDDMKKSDINDKNSDEEDITLNYCIDCKSDDLVEQYGRYVCRNCGLANEKVIDFKQEWRYYGSEDNKSNDPSRCGIPTNELLPNSSIGSVIGFGSKESNMMRRIRNMQYWNTIPYRETSLLESFTNISVLSQNAGISSCIIEDAKFMYKKVSELKSSRRTKKEAMKAASIYLACKNKGVPRTAKEIAKIFNIDNIKIMNKTIKSFEEIWNSVKDDNSIENDDENDDKEIQNDDNQETKYKSLQYLHRYCSNLNINDELYDICYCLINFIEENKILDTHNPLSRIAATLYYIMDKYKIDINKDNIISICDVSDVTINKCCNKLSKYEDEINELFSQFK
jgi:transcription initiation factor TFIIB